MRKKKPVNGWKADVFFFSSHAVCDGAETITEQTVGEIRVSRVVHCKGSGGRGYTMETLQHVVVAGETVHQKTELLFPNTVLVVVRGEHGPAFWSGDGKHDKQICPSESLSHTVVPAGLQTNISDLLHDIFLKRHLKRDLEGAVMTLDAGLDGGQSNRCSSSSRTTNAIACITFLLF